MKNQLTDRTAARHLRREGWRTTDKRVLRLWREEGLKVPQKQRKKRRLARVSRVASGGELVRPMKYGATTL